MTATDDWLAVLPVSDWPEDRSSCDPALTALFEGALLGRDYESYGVLADWVADHIATRALFPRMSGWNWQRLQALVGAHIRGMTYARHASYDSLLEDM